MKTVIKISAIIIGLFLYDLSYAAIKDPVVLEIPGTKSFRLILDKHTQNTQIKLRDESGVILYDESVQTIIGYNRVFNVSALPAGRYELEIEQPTKFETIPLLVMGGEVSLKEEQRLEEFKPFVQQKGKLVRINMFNKQQIPLNIRVYNDHNQLIFSEKLDNGLSVGKQYNLSKFKPGRYTIHLSSGKRFFSHSVML